MGMSLQDSLRVVPDAISFHLGARNVPHELNVRSLAGDATTDPPVLTLQDAYGLTQIQEEITTRIDEWSP